MTKLDADLEKLYAMRAALLLDPKAWASPSIRHAEESIADLDRMADQPPPTIVIRAKKWKGRE